MSCYLDHYPVCLDTSCFLAASNRWVPHCFPAAVLEVAGVNLGETHRKFIQKCFCVSFVSTVSLSFSKNNFQENINADQYLGKKSTYLLSHVF